MFLILYSLGTEFLDNLTKVWPTKEKTINCTSLKLGISDLWNILLKEGKDKPQMRIKYVQIMTLIKSVNLDYKEFSKLKYYSAIKKAWRLLHAMTWMNFENIKLNKRNKKRSHIKWFHRYKMSRVCKSTEIESRLVSVKRWDKEKIESDWMEILYGMKEMFWNRL